MAKKTPIDKLQAVIADTLDEYGEEVDRNMTEAVKAVAKAGATALRQSSKQTFGGTGEYASGWTAAVDEGRLSTSAVIYNSKVPGLPHLLEHGHAKRGGGRVEGRKHIEPVEEQIINEFQAEVEKRL